MSSKQKYHHGDLPDALVKAAVSLLKTKGPEVMSLREVARIAGVSHGAPAHHFGDKAGLLTAVAIAGYGILAESLNAAVAVEGLSKLERLTEAGRAYICFAIEHTAYFNVMFRPKLFDSESEVFQELRDSTRDILSQCVRDIAESNISDGVSESKVEVATWKLWSQVHGFSHLWLAGNMGDPNDMDRFEALFSQLFSDFTPKWLI